METRALAGMLPASEMVPLGPLAGAEVGAGAGGGGGAAASFGLPMEAEARGSGVVAMLAMADAAGRAAGLSGSIARVGMVLMSMACSAAPSSAFISSSALWKRSSGFLAIIRWM